MSVTITYDDFKKIDLRVAKILKAERIDGSEKLVKLQIDVGELGERGLVAGIGTSVCKATFCACSSINLYKKRQSPKD